MTRPEEIGIQRHRTLLLLAALTFGLKSLIFEPVGFWPLAFVCMTPWLVMIGASRSAPRMYFHSFVLGAAFFLLNMRWMIQATGAGYVALSIYQALYFPLVACPVRHAVRRRGWSLGIVFPILWVGGEMLRAVFLSGFPWFFLSHSLAGVLSLIQISDLVGAYGVSFLVAAVNGVAADFVFTRRAPAADPTGPAVRKTYVGRFRRGLSVSAALLVATIVYGQVQLHRNTTSEGPRVAVIQGDFVMTIFGEEAPDPEKERVYFAMMEAAAREKPDLFVLPETPWILFLNPEARDFYATSRRSYAKFAEFASKHNGYVVTGSASQILTPHDFLAKQRNYNSATLFSPDGSEAGRYDKVHLVYFGETVPFRFGRLRFLYFWLNRLMPFSGKDGTTEYSLFPGQEFKVFEMRPASQPGQPYRFGVPICYEDVMPYVARRFVSGGETKKRADFLLNISNDGWFGRGIQQPQHLAVCVFRAVENRVGIARAVNTGISAFIDPSGLVHHQVEADPAKRWPRKCGFSVSPIRVDTRYSLYSRWGDWFAWACFCLGTLIYIDYWVTRARGGEPVG